MKDLTRNYDYERLLDEEKKHFSAIEVTAELTEGGRHARDTWTYYWRRVSREIGAAGFPDIIEFVRSSGVGNGGPLRILSLGSGYCGHELQMAEQLKSDYRISCTDINEALFAEARRRVADRDLAVDFRTEDLNFIRIEAASWDFIFAHAVLHHVVNLEHLFEQVANGLAKGGIFHLVEVVGKNRKLLWDESEGFANRLLAILPPRFGGSTRLQVAATREGMEGVRQEEILPLLEAFFTPVFEYRHGAFMRFVCQHDRLSTALDPATPESRRYLDFLIDVDRSAVRRGILEPLELWGVYRPTERAPGATLPAP